MNYSNKLQSHGITVYLFFLAIPAKLDLDFNYNELSDIVQLDGPAGNSDMEEEEGGPMEENDFLGLINAEAIKALQEGEGSSDGNSVSSSSDSEGVDLAEAVEEVSEIKLDVHVILILFPHCIRNRWSVAIYLEN